MIIECPTCGTRYLVQIGLFAQGGRRVRCARCKHEWHEKLPTSVDVIEPYLPPPPPEFRSSSPPPRPAFGVSPADDKAKAATPPMGTGGGIHLPALIEKNKIPEWALPLGIALFLATMLVWILTSQRAAIVNALPLLRGAYEALGYELPPRWEGLVFENVKSELKYDSGTMKLYVDGTIRNIAVEVKTVPAIRARALGPDGRVILTWSVDSPARKVRAGDKVAFHTEIATSLERTINDVYLEFTAENEPPE